MIMEEWVWERLLADIEGRQVIPVIGPELLRVKVGDEEVPLYQYVADQLLERLELDREYLPPDYDFYQVVSEFLVQFESHPRHYELDLIYYKIREILGETEWEVPRPLRQLASIRHFDLYVTTTFDLLMERALAEERGGADAVRSLAYCKQMKPADLPESWANYPEPTVYHVFGTANKMNDFAVTDEDILHYAHRLQSFDFRPQNLFDQFREKRLLTLGCSFPAWLTRFFLAATKGEDLFTVGVPGLLADIRSPKNRELVGFLERKRTSVYTQGDAVSFVNELHRRWKERFGEAEEESEGREEMEPSSSVSEMEPDAVFISFRREDRDTARNVAARFRKAGIDTWFDETDLEPGDVFKEKITKHVLNCFAFVPLISKHSISDDPRPWFYRYEWKKAIEAAELRDPTSQFILPLLVDDTDPASERIPAEFRRCQICRIENIDDLVAAIRKRIRELRLEARGR